MAAVAVHEPVPVRRAPVAEEYHHLVEALGIEAPVIPHHCRALQVGLRVTFLGVNKIGKLLGVLDEEYGCVVSNQVPVAVFGIELDGESPGVTFGVSASLLSSDGRKPGKHPAFVTDLAEEFRLCVFCDVAGHGECAESAGSLGMYDPLRVFARG